MPKTWLFISILRAKKLFARSSYGHTHCEDDCIGKSRALGFSIVQTFVNLRLCDRRHSPISASLLWHFRADGGKAFDDAIEDNGATNMTTNGAFSGRILRSLLHKSVMVGCTTCRSLFLRECWLKVRFQHKYSHMQYCGYTQPIQMKVQLHYCNNYTICPCFYLDCTTANYEIPLMTGTYGPVGHVLSVSW